MTDQRRVPSRHTRRWLAVVAAMAMVVGACGDSDDGDDGASSTDTAAATSEIGRPDGRGDDTNRDDSDRGRTSATTAAAESAVETTSAPATPVTEAAATDDRRERESAATTTTVDATDESDIGDDNRTRRDATSTFALDVDTASLRLAEQAIDNGWLPDPTAVRVEEFVNAFDQGYPVPDDTFAIYADGGPYELVDDSLHVLRVGIQGTEVSSRRRPDANITVVVDVSGSMSGDGKIELVRNSLHLLVEELSDDDRIAIVAYGDTAWVELEPTFIDRRDRIHDAIDRLSPEGSTNAEAGLRLGYELADEMFDDGLVNQVMFMSDGVANVGVTDPNGILRRVADDASRGITMLAVGVGIVDVNDELLERIANDGDGVYAYVNDFDEAERLFSEELLSTLVTIAKDAKIQVEFDSRNVRSWRLLGFENRELTDREFDRSSTDAGEIGSGHAVTALYEVLLADDVGRRDRLATVTLRWFDPDGSERETVGDIDADVMSDSMRGVAPELRWNVAVAAAAEMLRASPWVDHLDPWDVLDELDAAADDLRGRDRTEFADLFAEAIDLGL